MILEKFLDLREIQSVIVELERSVALAELERLARVAAIEKLANEQYEIVADLLAEVEALRYQLTKFKEKINVLKEMKSLCSRLAKAKNEKKSALEALKKLKGEMKSVSEESKTITNLLVEKEKKLKASESAGMASELAAKVENLKTQLLTAQKEKNTYATALDQLKPYQSWEVHELCARAKTHEEDRDLYHSYFVIVDDLAEGRL
ncbi:hypothetical protein NE237_006957 [Protea cynaroides]|uniref:Uncharacterized protein n=1 Tax=Protea cynaroides TaxID=273540 RepID=A0A9Q0QVS7_9MAGN|nr:hypothetical protein NE237_006957 [Protea cynaroides]